MDEERRADICRNDEMKTSMSGEQKLNLGQATEAASGTSGGVRQAVDMVVDVTGHCEVVSDRPAGQWLTKDQLMAEYADNSSWVALRWSLLGLFLVCWLAMLGASVAIIFVTPGCAPRVSLDWWQSAVVYQVDVQSFQDTDDDGVGDLLGRYSTAMFQPMCL